MEPIAVKGLIAALDKIADIAMQCGYVDTKYFSQLFRKENGVLPVEYRRQA